MESGGRSPDVRSDRDLVLAFQAGDLAAYDEMYERYVARVYGVCSRILHQSQDAEEAAQETFVRAYQALHRFNGRYQLGAWLARIAANASVDQLRAKTRAPLVGLPDNQEATGEDVDPEKLVVGDHPRLTVALKDVKPLHAQALALRSVEGFSHEEIAERLAMTPAQVKALLHRARVSLRKAWDRAEGWLVAPVISMRSLFDDRSNGAAGSSVAGASPMFSPLLAEKVAATAFVVVAALAGLPPIPDGVQTPSTGRSRPAVSSSRHAPHGAPVDDSRVERSAPSAAAAEEETSPTDALPRLIETTLKGHKKLNDSDERRSDSDESPGVARTAAAAAKELIKEVREALPQGGPASPL